MGKHLFSLSFWIALGAGALLFLLVPMLGSIIIIGEKAGGLHPALEAAFYVALAALGYVFLGRPLLAVLAAPRFPIKKITQTGEPVEAASCRRLAKFILRRVQLEAEERAQLSLALRSSADLNGPLRAFFAKRAERMSALISQHAQLVFVSTAVSQSGRLDAVMVLGTNFRMVRALVESLGYRPPALQLAKMYAAVFAAALLAEGLEDLELEHIFPNVGATIIGSFPGLQLITASLLQGTANAFLTLRVGVLAKNYLLTAGENFVRHEARRAANREAAKMLRPVAISAVALLPGALKRGWNRLFA